MEVRAMTGSDILVIIRDGTTPIAGTYIKSDDINSHAESIEKASSSQREWKEYVAGRKEWKLTLNYLVMAAPNLNDLLMIGKFYNITLQDREGDYTLMGRAMMTDVKQTHTVGSICKGSWSLQGSGPLEYDH